MMLLSKQDANDNDNTMTKNLVFRLKLLQHYKFLLFFDINSVLFYVTWPRATQTRCSSMQIASFIKNEKFPAMCRWNTLSL